MGEGDPDSGLEEEGEAGESDGTREPGGRSGSDKGCSGPVNGVVQVGAWTWLVGKAQRLGTKNSRGYIPCSRG